MLIGQFLQNAKTTLAVRRKFQLLVETKIEGYNVSYPDSPIQKRTSVNRFDKLVYWIILPLHIIYSVLTFQSLSFVSFSLPENKRFRRFLWFLTGILLGWVQFYTLHSILAVPRKAVIPSSLIFMLICAFALAYTNYAKLLALVCIPTLCSSSARAVIVVLVIYLMYKGPVNNLGDNAYELGNALICGRAKGESLAKQYKDHMDRQLQPVKEFYQKVARRIEQFAEQVSSRAKTVIEIQKKVWNIIHGLLEFFFHFGKRCLDKKVTPCNYIRAMISNKEMGENITTHEVLEWFTNWDRSSHVNIGNVIEYWKKKASGAISNCTYEEYLRLEEVQLPLYPPPSTCSLCQITNADGYTRELHQCINTTNWKYLYNSGYDLKKEPYHRNFERERVTTPLVDVVEILMKYDWDLLNQTNHLIFHEQISREDVCEDLLIDKVYDCYDIEKVLRFLNEFDLTVMKRIRYLICRCDPPCEEWPTGSQWVCANDCIAPGSIIGGLATWINPMYWICMAAKNAIDRIWRMIKDRIDYIKKETVATFYVKVDIVGNFYHNKTYLEKKRRTSYSRALKNIKDDVRYLTRFLQWLPVLVQWINPFLSFLVVIRAALYIQKYRKKVWYDNVYLTNELIAIEFRRAMDGYETLLPLTLGERRRYLTATSLRMTRYEVTRLFWNFTTYVISMMVVFYYMLADHALYHLIRLMYDFKDDFNINIEPPQVQFRTSGQGAARNFYEGVVDDANLVLSTNVTNANETVKFNIKCWPVASQPDYDIYKRIAILFIYCVITCFIEAYTLRMRHMACNYFYPDMARQRALFLYNQIRHCRGTFTSFLMKQLIARITQDPTIDKVSLMDRLVAVFPLLQRLRRFFRIGKVVYCLNCGKQMKVKTRNLYKRCESTSNCKGLFCISCYENLHNVCTECILPIEIPPIVDEDALSEEKDSSDEDSDYYAEAYEGDQIGMEEDDFLFQLQPMRRRMKTIAREYVINPTARDDIRLRNEVARQQQEPHLVNLRDEEDADIARQHLSTETGLPIQEILRIIQTAQSKMK